MLQYHQYQHPEAKNTSHLVVLLHGYGANGHNLLSLAHSFYNTLPNACFLAPNAVEECESNFPDSYQWFSLYDANFQRHSLEIMAKSIKKANKILQSFIEEQLQKLNLGYDKLIIMGFSQGAMMAIYQSLILPQKILASLSFSGRVILPEMLGETTAQTPPICLIHGTKDDVLPFDNFLISRELLKERSIEHQAFAIDDLDHSIDISAVGHANNFLKTVLR